MKTEDVEISHPDKLLFPEAGLSKKDIAAYYKRIAEYLLPFVQDRPLTLRQYPHGIGKPGFFHKHAPDYFPDYVERMNVPMKSRDGKIMRMITADEPADLVYLAGQNVIELHMGLARKDDLEKPDQIILDLDPSDNDFEKVRQTAFILKDLLDEWGLPSFLKTTGSRGLHIHVPLRLGEKFAAVKEIAHHWARELETRAGEIATLEKRKDNRGDKVFIDYLRNDYGMTAVVPYSLRAQEEASVATPIAWEELGDSKLGPKSYTLNNIFRRLSKGKDPWATFTDESVTFEVLKKTLA